MKPSDPRLEALTQSIEALIQSVEQMPPGGDLEGLIEQGLSQIDQQLYQTLLERRQHAASATPEAFPPCALPPLPTPDAPRAAQSALGTHPARDAELRAPGL